MSVKWRKVGEWEFMWFPIIAGIAILVTLGISVSWLCYYDAFNKG